MNQRDFIRSYHAAAPQHNDHPHGGQHRAPVGVSTRDQTDRQRDLEALADFNAEWERIRYGQCAGREW